MATNNHNENNINISDLFEQKVLIKAKPNDLTMKGFLICIDPPTSHLVIYDDETDEFYLVLQHSIISIEPIDSLYQFNGFKDMNDLLEFFKECTVKEYSPEEIEDRRRKVLQLLKDQNVPVVPVDDTLIAAYHVCIESPYRAANCKSANSVILGKIKKIIKDADGEE